jgi:hypothetical protein
MYTIKIRQRQDYYYDVLVLNNSKLYMSKRKTDWETAKVKAQIWSYYFNNARIEVE